MSRHLEPAFAGAQDYGFGEASLGSETEEEVPSGIQE